MSERGLVRRVLSKGRRTARAVALRLLGRSTNEQLSIRRQRLAEVRQAALEAVAGAPDRPDVHLATAVGAGLAVELKWEVRTSPVDPARPGAWTQPLPDLLLVEVARSGVPGWTRGVAAGLAQLAEAARQADVPVVVWATGDGLDPEALPALKPLLELATRVFVSAPSRLEEWRTRVGGAEVELLLPAVQPRLNHPGAGGNARVPAACVLMDPPAANGSLRRAPDPLLETTMPRSLIRSVDIWPIGDAAGKTRDVPEPLAGRVTAPVDPGTAAGVARGYRVLLDAGRGEPTSSWGLLRAGAAQTAVITDAAHARLLPDELRDRVCVVDNPDDLAGAVSARVNQPELRDREGLQLQRAVLGAHTLRHRVDSLLQAVGRQVEAVDTSVSAVVPTNREHEIDNILANLGRQRHAGVQLVLVLHGLDVDEPALRARAEAAGVGNLVLVHAEHSLTLGACMNLGVEASDGRYVAKMDDDNHYGAHYLGDLVSALRNSDAQIAGKWAHYVWLRATGAVVLRHPTAENTYERRVQGGSMLFEADLVRSVRFSDIPRAVDSDILDRAMDRGAKVFSADRFNFVSIRGTDRTAHTWTVADHTFMTPTGLLTFFGDPREHVDV
ncbi:glycosyltransferase [Angustibacter sp. McL0619]|uniref:glycosyltransferase n=1 Tax=Angustibacter sp. McL0619 TaxID=3415676 RepID=UPI003CEEC613